MFQALKNLVTGDNTNQARWGMSSEPSMTSGLGNNVDWEAQADWINGRD